VGFSLGVTGAAMQGLMRNPFADWKRCIGSAALTFYFGLAGVFSFALPMGGIAGSLWGNVPAVCACRTRRRHPSSCHGRVAIDSPVGAFTVLAQLHSVSVRGHGNRLLADGFVFRSQPALCLARRALDGGRLGVDWYLWPCDGRPHARRPTLGGPGDAQPRSKNVWSRKADESDRPRHRDRTPGSNAVPAMSCNLQQPGWSDPHACR
jgi:hypothetical protein